MFLVGTGVPTPHGARDAVPEDALYAAARS
jgi:hypothetical protein